MSFITDPGGQTTAIPRRIPVLTDDRGPEERNTHDVLVGIANLLGQLVAESRRTNVRLDRIASAGSGYVEFDSNGSAGTPKIKIKEAAEGPPVDAALESVQARFLTAMADLEDAKTAGWRATVDALAERVDANLREDVGALPREAAGA